MKKAISLVLVAVICLLIFASCDLLDFKKDREYRDALAKIPAKDAGGETTLEFWLGDDVDDYDWSEYDEIYGWFGAWEYLGKGYKKIVTEDESGRHDSKPLYHVSYIVTSFPDHSSERKCVTSIDITDPTVKFYGLTTECTVEEFEAKFASLGFTVTDGEGALSIKKAVKDIVTIFFTPTFTTEDGEVLPAKFSIRVEVTNKMGIIF